MNQKNINAQQWLDKKYPANGICSRSNDPDNKGKTRKGITTLDLRKGKVGNGLFSSGKNLVEDCKFTDFPNLRKLIISTHDLTSLDVSNLTNLEELDCRSNEITDLNVANCVNLRKIDCANNPLRNLDLSTCLKLEEVNLAGCNNLDESVIKSQLFYDIENKKLTKNKNAMKNSPQITKAQANDIRNILIIGITGNGKSTLSNVLTDTNQFIENSSSTSVTKNFQSSNIFEHEGKKYRVIDNIGFNDTNNISNQDILFKIGEGINAAKEGLNQVLFVFKDRFSEDQIIAFNLFKDFIAETGITKFTTIVKTGFEDFQETEACENDRETLLNQSKTLKEIIGSCNGVIYVNNPSIPIIKETDPERIKKRNEQRATINKEKRSKSREIVLNHLVDNCLENYKLKEWDSIVSVVNDYNERKKQIEQGDYSNKSEQLSKEKENVVRKIDKSIEGSLGISVPGLPVSLNLGFKKMNIQEEQRASIEVLQKEI